jgi:hypothetical protein
MVFYDARHGEVDVTEINTWVRDELRRGVRMSTFTVALATLVALRLPIAQLRLPEGSRSLTVAGVTGQFSKLTSASGVKLVTVLLLIELIVLLVVSLAAGMLPSERGSRRRRLLDVSVATTSVVVGLLTLALIPVLGAADHVDGEYGVAPFHVDGGGVVTMLIAVVLALSTTWHNHQVNS